MATMGQLWANTGSTLATLMFTYTIFRRWFPHVGDHLEPFFQRLFSRFYPYIQIKFHEYSGEHFKRSESKATSGIQSYLSKDSSLRAKKLKANTTKGSKSLVLSMDDREEITDEFESVTVWWQSKKVRNTRQSFSFYPAADEKRYYTLKFHRHFQKETASKRKRPSTDGLVLGSVEEWLGQSLVVFDVVFLVVGLPSIVPTRLGFQDQLSSVLTSLVALPFAMFASPRFWFLGSCLPFSISSGCFSSSPPSLGITGVCAFGDLGMCLAASW
ncbi:hypothetical protein DY000_02025755 [Brassica cretica]|uniref:AAA-type ATPase N-terminal domain-containing protein n=1 Tax=Brassica cretica TaxID=69181 RepID=A0ABQ7E998_BRACR|nr:hypothetical protein DY000_02025755 [Brassica cretica]